MLLATQPCATFAQTVTPQAPANDIRVESIEGRVEVNPGGNTQWRPAALGQPLRPGDRVRTREFSSVSIRWSDKSRVRLAELADVQIQPAAGAKQRASFSLFTGVLYFFNRERLTNARYGTRNASAAIRGTEFVLEAEDNRTILTVVEGEVDLSNEVDSLTLRTGEQGIAEPGLAPRKVPAIFVNNVIQWALYYPAILDIDELGLTLAERNRLAASMAAYKSGELLRALELLSAPAAAESSPEKIYRAALLLAVGNVAQAQQVLDTVGQASGAAVGPSRSLRLADALRQLIAVVKLQPWKTNASPELASEWLAQSYSHQSRGDLRNALQAARASVEISPDFGFGWTRVAELEFSFGHTRQAQEALERGLLYSPRNAQALALKGFVLAAQNHISAAIFSFNRAIGVDPNLANAWLGRGLCLIRQGHSQRGREDLLTAVAMEPQRAILRSYLAKAYTDVGDEKRALHELQFAKNLDENDPTAWLYSALLNEQENHINDAVRDLEKSQDLTGSRHIYRSGLLLDQDRAVRSANLARIYQDAGMSDVAIREASRAVSYDYANYSAHLFLADSYNSLRDPKRISLRYETSAENEYLIANLLAPVGAGTLSQTISQHEYSKLFERDRLGLVSSTEYFSNGDWVQQGAQFGTYRNSSYAVEGKYRFDNGQRPNNEFEMREIVTHVKQQLSAADTIYFQTIWNQTEAGDVKQYFSQTEANPSLRTKEIQEPILVGGYHHEWNPGVHTLILGSRYADRFSVDDPFQISALVLKEDGITPNYIRIFPIRQDYRSTLEIYSGELQQIWEHNAHTVIAGLTAQTGEFETENFQQNPDAGDDRGYFPVPAADQQVRSDFERFSVYGYEQWRIHPTLQLIAGLSYDLLTFPKNFRSAPVSDDEETTGRLSPKAGVIWRPARATTVRFAYTRSVAGIAGEQSYRLEPTQVAGFNQSFRSIVPESVKGAQVGARFETYSISIEQAWPTDTYTALTGEILKSKVRTHIGIFDYTGATFFAAPGDTPEHIDFEEKSIMLSLHQLIGDYFAIGGYYRLSEASLDDAYPQFPDPPALFVAGAIPFAPHQHVEALLHQVDVHATVNHSSGAFGMAQAVWYGQNNLGYSGMGEDEFWQFNLFLGFRFPQRHVELAIGLLNIADQDYRLNPLNIYRELPRERTLFARCRLSF